MTHSSRQQKPGPQVGSTKSVYDARRARVDKAHLRMQEISSRQHPPADARQAAAELDEALRDATVVAAEALRSAEPIESGPRKGLRRRKATRAMAPLVRLWSIELLRLSEIAVWLRRTTLDDPGVHLPATGAGRRLRRDSDRTFPASASTTTRPSATAFPASVSHLRKSSTT